jgi:hypothetical protein
MIGLYTNDLGLSSPKFGRPSGASLPPRPPRTRGPVSDAPRSAPLVKAYPRSEQVVNLSDDLRRERIRVTRRFAAPPRCARDDDLDWHRIQIAWRFAAPPRRRRYDLNHRARVVIRRRLAAFPRSDSDDRFDRQRIRIAYGLSGDERTRARRPILDRQRIQIAHRFTGGPHACLKNDLSKNIFERFDHSGQSDTSVEPNERPRFEFRPL